MSLPTLGDITIARGEARYLDTEEITGADLDSASIQFGIAESDTTEYVETLSTSVSAQVITGDLTSAKSLALTRSRYYYSCWITIGSDSTLVARGYINLKNDARNR